MPYRFSIDAMKSPAPVVRLIKPGHHINVAGWRADPSTSQPTDSDSEILINLDLLASQRSLTPTLDSLSWWTQPMPVPSDTARDTAAGRGRREESYPPVERELLRGLILRATFNRDVGQFAVCTTHLEQWAFTKPPSLDTPDGNGAPVYLGQQLANLRRSLRTWTIRQLSEQNPEKSQGEISEDAFLLCRAAIKSRHGIECATHGREESFHYVDATLVRVDWFQVLGACESARLEQNSYQRAYCLNKAQGCYRRSSERTPDEQKHLLAQRAKQARLLQEQGEKLSQRQERDLDHVRLVGGKLWEVRNQYLDALRDIGHTDRIVMHYRLWLRRGGALADDLTKHDEYFEYKGGTNEPQDEFFGYTYSEVKQQLEILGRKELPGSQDLASAAADRLPGVTASPDIEGLNCLANRLDGALAGDRRIDVHWPEMRALTVEVTRQLAEARGRKAPGGGVPKLPVFEVVVAVGRGGALLATALCQILGVRLMGTMAMSRYVDSSARRGTVPYIRGVELPVVNARRVLICDDVIKSGVTIHTALDVLKTAYPQAEFHIAAYLADGAIMQSKRATGGRHDRGADQWYAGMTHRLRRPDLPHRDSWLNFRWAPIDITA